MTSSALPRRRPELTAADLDRVARLALGVVVLAAALLIFHLTRGGSFSVDDWTWIQERRGNDLHTFLAPYNGHLSLVPIAIYRLMFATAGISDVTPFRVLLVVIDAVVGLIFFLYARPRIGDFGALGLAALMLFLGPGWNDILQPFQIAWLIAVGGAVAALALLDRRRSWADAAACLLVAVSLASTSVGVPMALGIAVEIGLTRRRWRDAWIVGGPGLLYMIWALYYHSSGIFPSAITSVPTNLATTTAGALAGDAGLAGITPFDLVADSLVFGIPLLVVALAVLIARWGGDWDARRFASLTVALVAFSALTTLARAFQPPFESRYMYVTCVLVALIVVELVRGVPLGLTGRLTFGILVVAAIVGNYGSLISGAGWLRGLGSLTDARFGAVELDRGRVADSTPVALYPLGATTAGQYFRATAAVGTPAYSVRQLQGTNPAAQAAADQQLLADGDVTFAGLTSAPPADPGLRVSANTISGGTVRPAGACLEFTPSAAQAPGSRSAFTVRLTSGRLVINAVAEPTTAAARRFAQAFTGLGTVQPGGEAVVSVVGDRTALPWELQMESLGRVRVCPVAGP